MRSNRTGRTTDNRLFRWNGRFFFTFFKNCFNGVKSRLLRRLLYGRQNSKKSAAMPRLLSWGSPPSKSFISSLHLTFRQKPRGKRRSRQKVCPRGHSSSISFCRAGTCRHSPAPPAAPPDARRSAPPSVLHKGLGWSRLSARSALQSVSRFEVSTGDPRPSK